MPDPSAADRAAVTRPAASAEWMELGNRLQKPLVLVGIMGVGKSTVGRRLAEALGFSFADADDEIERAAGLSVSEIFERHGEPEFRRGERRVIERLLKQSNGRQVIATGGGAFVDPQTRAAVKKSAVSIWLRAPIDVLLARVSRRDDRPLLKTPDPRGRLEELLAQRTPAYQEADLSIDSTAAPHSSTVNSILTALSERYAK
jgi:shikimate kinase